MGRWFFLDDPLDDWYWISRLLRPYKIPWEYLPLSKQLIISMTTIDLFTVLASSGLLLLPIWSFGRVIVNLSPFPTICELLKNTPNFIHAQYVIFNLFAVLFIHCDHGPCIVTIPDHSLIKILVVNQFFCDCRADLANLKTFWRN